MCTLTFFPINGGYILTTNRDEMLRRDTALAPQAYTVHGQKVFFPKDPQAGGTWVAAGAKHSLCLMNGAFDKHIPQPPYRMSRGVMLLDFFRYDDIDSFCSEYDFAGIENFTMILLKGRAETLCEIRWDGLKLSRFDHPCDAPKLWASAPLYPKDLVQKRRAFFFEHLNIFFDNAREHILRFHTNSQGDDIAQRVCLSPLENGLQTLSITSIMRSEMENSITYVDKVSGESHSLKIDFTA